MRSSSYIFLLILVIIAVFLFGVRYGQRVEKTNKIIDFYISLTPKITPSPTPTPIATEEYKSKRWGLKFRYPANFQIKESTNTPEIFIEEKHSSN